MTFGAPGVSFAVSKDQAAAASDNVVNYMLPGDLVGMRGTHVGQTVMILPSGTTAIKDGGVLAVATAVGGPLGLLVAANHPLGNYAQALANSSASASSSAGGGGAKPAARMGDMTAHGGSIVIGMPTVLIA